MKQMIKYRQFEIILESTLTGWRGRWIAKVPPHGEITNGKTEQELMQSIKDQIDANHKAQLAKRGPSGYPNSDEVLHALNSLDLNDPERLMLKAHYQRPDYVLTASELAKAAGYDSYEVANSIYGKLGRKLAEEMDWNPKELNAEGRPIWTYSLATCSDNQALNEIVEGEHWEWQMRPELADALESYF
ncbi:MAG: hypothetical protein ACI9KA_001066 [Parasphingorhabdus sp.]|jgi:hypothetical protein|uniref:hypothetical protein n=1 Tax=Parasphingorhabdus sp. TaxID=2709688 RepID=UPI0039E2D453